MGLNRRTLLKGLAATATCGLGIATSQRPAAALGVPDTRPNVLWIITDDQMRSSLSYMPRVQKRLVGRGTRFRSGYSAIPLCGPARASMMSGTYPHNHGCLTNGTHQPFVDQGRDQDTVATRMKAGGYETGYFGKYMNGMHDDRTYVAPGWDRWVNWIDGHEFCVDGTLRTAEQAHVDPYAAYRCQTFIEARADRPWFAVFAPRNPHAGGGFEATPEHAHDFDDVRWDSEAFNEADMSDKAPHLRDLPLVDRSQMSTRWESILEELQDTDDQIGQLLNALATTGQLDRTFIFFVSDNGLMLGEHRMTKKSKPYEESAGIPFVATGPGVPVGVSRNLVSQVDLMPTTLAVAGLDPDAGRALDGRSMLEPLRTQDWSAWRRRMLVEHPNNGWSLLREDEWAYIDYYAQAGQEIYDLSADPAQMTNLSGGGTVGPIKAAMREKSEAMRQASGLALRALEEA